MKKLAEFALKDSAIFEARTRKGPEAENVVGKDAEKNGTGGQWGINEPKSDEAVEPLKKEELNKNMKRLLMKFKAEEPFFIVGEAGWGKTSIIKSMAKRFNREVITVYLDKAVASDLGGIPVPVKGKDNNAEQQMAMPQWAAYMKNNPDKQFLLFFDEMNQAAPDVMNALMPIVLENEICNVKFDNFFVGAAGNFEHENKAVSELSGPLESRFKPIIVWETGGEGEWRQAFKYIHEQWDDKLSKALVDKFEKHAQLFVNPREVEQKILKFLYKLKSSGDLDFFDTEDYLERLENLSKEGLSRSHQEDLKRLAEAVNDYMTGKEAAQETSSRRKGQDMIDEDTKKIITNAVKRGYLTQKEDGKIVKYGISRENIPTIFCDEEYTEMPINKEMLDRFINKLEADGITFKYETNADWKKAGLLDPTV